MKFSQFSLLFAFAFLFAFSKAASVPMDNDNLNRRTNIEGTEQEKGINTFNKRTMSAVAPTKSFNLVTRSQEKRDSPDDPAHSPRP